MKEKVMRTTLTRLTLPFVLLASLATGCNLFPVHINRDPAPKTKDTPGRGPDAAALVEYLNDNASRVQSIQCDSLAVDAKQNGRAIGLSGSLVFQKPKNLRVRLDLLGKPAADLGSNEQEFWFWVSQNEPPYVYHCSYAELGSGQVALNLPFQPEMLVAAMGIGSYDSKGKYELRDNPKLAYLELVESTTSAQGQPVTKVTAFNRKPVKAPSPQVIGYSLYNDKGTLLCRTQILETQVHAATGAILPQKVVMEWPRDQMKMTLMMPNLKVITVTPERAAKVFQRGDLSRYESFDLAKRALDNPSGLQRTEGRAPPTR
jgi:hypothetical protein